MGMEQAGRNYPTASGAQPPASPLLDQHHNTMAANTSRVEALTDRLHALADRVIGTRPTPINDARNGTSAPVPQAANVLGRMSDLHRYAEQVSDKLLDAVERLEAL